MRRWLIRLAGDGAEIWRHTVSPWQSITFSGERHAICLKLGALEQVERLTSADLEVIPFPGALVVEATVTGMTCEPDHWWLFIELLTLCASGIDA